MVASGKRVCCCLRGSRLDENVRAKGATKDEFSSEQSGGVILVGEYLVARRTAVGAAASGDGILGAPAGEGDGNLGVVRSRVRVQSKGKCTVRHALVRLRNVHGKVRVCAELFEGGWVVKGDLLQSETGRIGVFGGRNVLLVEEDRDGCA